MKKLSEKQRRHLIYKSRKNFIKLNKIKLKKKNHSIISLWDGEREFSAECTGGAIMPPRIIDFEKNISETLLFLEIIKEKMGRKTIEGITNLSWTKKRRNKIPSVKSYYDFSKIEYISISSALVISASYDRAKRLTKSVPPAVNYLQWSPSATQTFYEIGFFDLIGQSHPQNIIDEYEKKHDSNIKIMKIISGTNANKLQESSERIRDILIFLVENNEETIEYIPNINTAISEAMINVARHAYPDSYVNETKYSTINQWWITAKANKKESTLTISIYDQGATIPGTLPNRGRIWDLVEYNLKRIIPDFIYSKNHRKLDHEYIAFAVKPGKTQTESRERGLGLPQMQDLVNMCDDGYISIISRCGYYRYDKTNGPTKRALTVELEGTLVEWHLKFPVRDVL
ncbi:hypothetical protein JK191_01515 [Gluconobacter sphaericus]|uniref:hypothetical protein n=1 Tax=Gluconobacter sphaericus TaxID=574987 RepID=UPI001B8B764F|nr:hypothetical protein [Gluconobacter sphaericus]MBS1096272.1 hypothetical protein [Gluconobacter sphaericus]